MSEPENQPVYSGFVFHFDAGSWTEYWPDADLHECVVLTGILSKTLRARFPGIRLMPRADNGFVGCLPRSEVAFAIEQWAKDEVVRMTRRPK